MRKVNLVLFFTIIVSGSLFAQEWYMSVYDSIGDIEVRVDSTTGLYAIGTHNDGIPMTYNFDAPESIGFVNGNAVTFNIRGTTYRSSSALSPEADENLDDYFVESTYNEEEKTIISKWAIPLSGGDLVIYQKACCSIYFIAEYIDFEYEIINQTAFPIPFGLKIFINETNNPADEMGIIIDYPLRHWITLHDSLEALHSLIFIDLEIDYFGIGEYLSTENAISKNPWDIEPEDWIGEPISDNGIFMRTDIRTIEVSSNFIQKFSYGHAVPYNAPIMLWPPPEEAFIDHCELDSIINLSLRCENTYLVDSIYNVRFCLDFNSSSELYHIGRYCDTLGHIPAYGDSTVNLSFGIPDSYSASETIYDTLIYIVNYETDSLCERIIQWPFTIPHFTASPPEIEFLFADSTRIPCAGYHPIFRFWDEDTIVDYSSLRISIITGDDSLYISPHYAIRLGDTVYLHLDEIIYGYRDSLTLHGFFELCINSLKDSYRCDIDTVCITLEMPSPEILNIELLEGWNMLSLPIDSSAWNDLSLPESPAPLYFYEPNSYVYNETVAVPLGLGFWYFSIDDTIITHTDILSEAVTMDFTPGWNLIGLTNDTISVDTMSAGELMLPAYQYNTSTESYDTTSILQSGKGYFIYAHDSLTLEIE